MWVPPPWNENGEPRKPDNEARPIYVFMEGGGTGTWIGLVNKGLFVPEEISWGGWGDRMSWEKEQVPAGQKGVSELEEANHHPVATFMGDENRTVCRVRAAPGETFPLDASNSRDPDGDPIGFKWSYYPEAGTYPGKVGISKNDQAVAEIAVPKDAGGKQIHVILEVLDQSPIAPLTSYRRIVIDVDG